MCFPSYKQASNSILTSESYQWNEASSKYTYWKLSKSWQ